MEPITQLTADDFEETMDFLNLVFSVHGPHDFARLLPKLYQPTDQAMQHNYAIKKNGRIRAIVGIFPMILNIGGKPLKLAGIGGVSVHPSERRAGHMKRLMTHCLQEIKRQDFQLSWLDGQRQRYGYFGYELSGQVYHFQVDKTNIRHCYSELPEIQFESLKTDKRDVISKIKSWHDSGPIFCARPVDHFFSIARSWHHELYTAKDSASELLGYVIADIKAGRVLEIGAESEDHLRDLIPAWVNFQDRQSVVFETPPLSNSLTRELGGICERAAIHPSGNWRIFDWKNVMEAALRLKQLHEPLMTGILDLAVPSYGLLKIQVTDSGISCFASKDKPENTLALLSFTRKMFGPLPSTMADNDSQNINLLRCWLPLPLYLPRQDQV